MSIVSSDQTESNRVLALRAMKILDTAKEEAFERLARMAAAHFDVPTVLISLIDEDRQWFKSRVGFDLCETDRSSSFCTQALGAQEPLIVPDALADERFSISPLVTGEPYIRFYAGAQLRTQDELDLGTFCLIDTNPRPPLSSQDLALLQDFAATTTLVMEQRRLVLEYEAHVVARLAAEGQMVVAKEQAEAAAETMRALFSQVSHDLRTPLAAISGFSELLADSPLTDEQQSDLQEVQRAARDLLAMIDSLLQVARQREDEAPEAD